MVGSSLSLFHAERLSSLSQFRATDVTAVVVDPTVMFASADQFDWRKEFDRIVLFIDLEEAWLPHIIMGLELSPFDAVIFPFDSPDRLHRIVQRAPDRRWSLQLTRLLSKQLASLPNQLGLLAFGTLSSAFNPDSVARFCEASGGSFNTTVRKMRLAGLPSIRRLLIGGRLMQAIEPLRQRQNLAFVAREVFQSSPATVSRAFREFAQVGIPEVRDGFPPQELARRVAEAVASTDGSRSDRAPFKF
jgi:hypothetical protein